MTEDKTHGAAVRNIYILTAVLYPLVALAAFYVSWRADPFLVFERTYAIVWLIFVPAFLILMSVGLAFTGRAPRHYWRLALMAWIAVVTYGHFRVIDMAAGGV